MNQMNGSANHEKMQDDTPGLEKSYGTHADASKFMSFKARVVSDWALSLQPTSASRAVLRGFIARLDPAVADRIFLAICEQIAADAIMVGELCDEQLRQQVSALRQQGISNDPPSATTPVRCGTCYDARVVPGGERGEVTEPCPVCGDKE